MCDCPVKVTTSLVKDGVPVLKYIESRHVLVGSNPGLETNSPTVVVSLGDRGSTVVKVLSYKSEGR